MSECNEKWIRIAEMEERKPESWDRIVWETGREFDVIVSRDTKITYFGHLVAESFVSVACEFFVGI